MLLKRWNFRNSDWPEYRRLSAVRRCDRENCDRKDKRCYQPSNGKHVKRLAPELKTWATALRWEEVDVTEDKPPQSVLQQIYQKSNLPSQGRLQQTNIPAPSPTGQTIIHQYFLSDTRPQTLANRSSHDALPPNVFCPVSCLPPCQSIYSFRRSEWCVEIILSRGSISFGYRYGRIILRIE
jgi:hypothetical protein